MMWMAKKLREPILALLCALCGSMATDTNAQQLQMPRENVVDVPAKGDGLCLSNLFQSNMVLQRDQPISIWGWATSASRVMVTLANDNTETIADKDGYWRVTLPARPTSTEPLALEVAVPSKTIYLDNILIGDVWVLGGQSNMEFPLDRIENGQLEIVSANHEQIRILTIPAANGPEPKSGFERLHEWSGWFSRHYRKGDWDVCSPEIVRELSAIGYVFARRIHMASKVPIGVIDASRGGTTVETWTPLEVLRKIETPQVKQSLTAWDEKIADWDSAADLTRRVTQFQNKIARLTKEGKPLPAKEAEPTDLRPGPAMDQNRPGNCFASMITPLHGLQIKGAIFHQGYNNCFNGTQGAMLYRQVFPKMIEAWRLAFMNPEMPFGILSLCTEGTPQTMDNFCEMMANPGPYIREAQYQTFLDLYRSGDSNIGFASTYDLRRRWYHPQLKIPAGERMARWALATQYQLDGKVRWKPPMVKEVNTDGGQVMIEFDEPVGGVDDGGPISGFAIAGVDRKFHPALATHLVIQETSPVRSVTKRNAIVLTSPMVPHPIHYRYAWGRSPLGNLQADRNTDIPIATQRSDQWTLESTPQGLFGDQAPLQLERAQRRQLQQALRNQDLERRLFEARQLIESAENN